MNDLRCTVKLQKNNPSRGVEMNFREVHRLKEINILKYIVNGERMRKGKPLKPCHLITYQCVI